MVRPAAPTGSGSWGFAFYGSINIMIPVSIYIDGFNLYHALRRFRDNRVKWLDLAALSQRIIAPRTERISKIKYFSAYAYWLPGPSSRHREYVKALENTGVVCIMGHFKPKDKKCHHCNCTWTAHEEKETDVSIGITMLNDAYKGEYEKAYLVTRDSDLMPAIKTIRQEFPAKEIVAVAPPLLGHSNDLIRLCNAKKKIKPPQIWSSLLPKEIVDSAGTVVATRPREYD
jgi:uncharacterized LabA/DUF88 family protein